MSTPEQRAARAATMRRYWKNHPDKYKAHKKRVNKYYHENTELCKERNLICREKRKLKIIKEAAKCETLKNVTPASTGWTTNASTSTTTTA